VAQRLCGHPEQALDELHLRRRAFSLIRHEAILLFVGLGLKWEPVKSLKLFESEERLLAMKADGRAVGK
jgi:hypothetical protein